MAVAAGEALLLVVLVRVEVLEILLVVTWLDVVAARELDDVRVDVLNVDLVDVLEVLRLEVLDVAWIDELRGAFGMVDVVLTVEESVDFVDKAEPARVVEITVLELVVLLKAKTVRGERTRRVSNSCMLTGFSKPTDNLENSKKHKSYEIAARSCCPASNISEPGETAQVYIYILIMSKPFRQGHDWRVEIL